MSGSTPLGLATRRVSSWLGDRRPEVALVLGSGLGGLTADLRDPLSLAYRDIPGFPEPGVAGHAGQLIVGSLGGRIVLCQSGRFHAYEGHSPDTLALPVRLFAALEIPVLLLTNAAGGIRRTLRPGSLMLVADHLNLTFRNPLIGKLASGETRFPDMSEPYDVALRATARRTAAEEGIPLEEGVYAGVLGPSYETPAEIQALGRLGADAVGMSTVFEVVTARARGLRCLAISTITNRAAGLSTERLSHEAVIAMGATAEAALGRLLAGLLARLPV